MTTKCNVVFWTELRNRKKNTQLVTPVKFEQGLYFDQKYSTNVKFLVFKINVLQLCKILKLREAG